MARKDRKRRQNGYVAFGNALLMIVVLGMVGAGAVIYWGWSQFSAPGPNTEERSFFVEENAGFNTTADRLKEQGFIDDSLVFKVIGGRLMNKTGDLKPGEFKVAAKASMSDVLTLLTETKPIVHFVMVNPGETSFVAAAKLNDPGEMLIGDAVAVPAEGTVLPVRYDYTPPSATRAELLKQMQDEMAAAVDAAWTKCSTELCGDSGLIKTKLELVTLASLIEEETGVPDERSKVAAVFVNRLKKGMRLQTDPSVLYGITGGKEDLGRGPTSAELKQDTPYNTYQHGGLPPGPISNPGEDSLMAAARPAAEPVLYFVAKSANRADGHVFAETYAEHRKNVAAYRQAVADAEAEAERAALEAEQAAEGGDTTQ